MKNEAFPIADKQDFNAWKLQNPNAFQMLDAVIFAWRGSSARKRGHLGRFAAYSREEWAGKSSLSLSQAKRALKRLETDGLILRVDATFAGTTRCSFYQPTKIALKFKGRPNDVARLEEDFEASEITETPQPAPQPAPLNAPEDAPQPAPLPAPYITSLPSPSTSSISTTLQQEDSGNTNKEGKGRTGKKVKLKIKLKKPIPANEDTPQPPADADAMVEAGIKKFKQGKLEKLLAKFPILTGAHAKAVKHPYQRYGDQWATWSLPHITKMHEKYSAYVDNWYSGKNGEGCKPLSHEYVDETALDADLNAKLAEWDKEIEEESLLHSA